MNFPNSLTVFRIILTFIFILLVTKEELLLTILAAIVFFFASFTDFLDGYLARKHDAITDFGKLMDPIADKFLILSAFFIFMRMEFFPLWVFLIILIREVLITGIRLVAVRNKRILAAESAGKFKTFSQILLISYILLYIILWETYKHSSHFSNEITQGILGMILFTLISIVVLLTVFSGLTFLWNNRQLINVR